MRHHTRLVLVTSFAGLLAGCASVKTDIRGAPQVKYRSAEKVTIEHVNMGSEVTMTLDVKMLAAKVCKSFNATAEYTGVYRDSGSGPEEFDFRCVADQPALAVQSQSASQSRSKNIIDNESRAKRLSDGDLCSAATYRSKWDERRRFLPFVVEAQRRGLDCGVAKNDSVSTPLTPRDSMEDSQAQFLSILETQITGGLSSEKQVVDVEPPSLNLDHRTVSDVRAILTGRVADKSGVAEVTVNGQVVNIDKSGNFEFATYVPLDGITMTVEAIDLKGLKATTSLQILRPKASERRRRLASIDPLTGPKQTPSRYRAALIIGLEEYEAALPAQFAARDAQAFADYAREKLGVPAGNLKLLTNADASEREILRALKSWLPTIVEPGLTDLYVFYAGHGMPAVDGSSAFFVPYDGDVQLLDDTAISRDRFLSEIAIAQPKSATFFFDNCFSGATRSERSLVAQRPLGIKVAETEIPDNYLIFSAGESDQTAGVLEEVQHGKFSYFVFKGLEGGADQNRDGRISAGELHSYVRESVGRFSAWRQTPVMSGSASTWVIN